ncbi:MAG: TAXI family TRAP transporter solute-binding subunit [Stomatobaculum sp.]|nr:TAXI family TRAP transporter solute-binding subunit [Stomatobaculum sp.]
MILTVLLVLLCGGCSGSAGNEKNAADHGPEQKEDFMILTIGTADSGGSMYAASSAIAGAVTQRDDSIRFNIIASTGSFHNVEGLMRGEMDLALVSGDAAAEAAEGRGHFEGRPAEKLRAVCAVYPSISAWMTLSASPFKYVADLKGGKAAIGPEDSSTELAAKNALKALGLDPDAPGFINAGLGSGADMVASCSVDAVHAFAGSPVPGLTSLAKNFSCRLLKYRDEELEKILSEEPAYYAEMIPAGTYSGQKEDVKTFGVKCLLCVSADMPEEQVYHLSGLLCDALPELSEQGGMLSRMEDPAFLLDGLPVELHPGAKRCFEERFSAESK